MFQRDYLMKQLLVFFQAVSKSLRQHEEDRDPLTAAGTLEDAISSAVDIDADALLSLSPESLAQVMRVSSVDPSLVEYVARALLLESSYLREGKEDSLAQVRELQARALAAEYEVELPNNSDGPTLSPSEEVDLLWGKNPAGSENPMDPDWAERFESDADRFENGIKMEDFDDLDDLISGV